MKRNYFAPKQTFVHFVGYPTIENTHKPQPAYKHSQCRSQARNNCLELTIKTADLSARYYESNMHITSLHLIINNTGTKHNHIYCATTNCYQRTTCQIVGCPLKMRPTDSPETSVSNTLHRVTTQKTKQFYTHTHEKQKDQNMNLADNNVPLHYKHSCG